MSDNHFKVTDMTCSYKEGFPVLSIRELNIPRNKLIFVIGLSGIGKSTFIEALGLMNNIFDAGKQNAVTFFPNKGIPIELSKLWFADNPAISLFRNRHFSFIFQNTNLMENFSAGENMCISQLIGGKPFSEAKPVVLEIMNQLNLTTSVFDKKVTALSGGQRQRLAFVRAITAEFEVLFGDEPTGNLDRDTGYRLMRILKKHLIDTGRTGIIVSHDLELALHFADQIIMLTPLVENGGAPVCGTVDSKSVLYHEHASWRDSDGNLLANPMQHIAHILGIQSDTSYA